jgi:hypothetical protein
VLKSNVWLRPIRRNVRGGFHRAPVDGAAIFGLRVRQADPYLCSSAAESLVPVGTGTICDQCRPLRDRYLLHRTLSSPFYITQGFLFI